MDSRIWIALLPLVWTTVEDYGASVAIEPLTPSFDLVTDPSIYDKLILSH